MDSPLGALHLTGLGDALMSLHWSGDVPDAPFDANALPEARAQLAAYFAGGLTQFDLPLAPDGTAFQRSVWTALCDIPFGQTRTYGDIARAVGKPRGSQAVGQANGRNPIPIIIPCHRVVATGGGIGGYSGGLPTKRHLLNIEGIAFEPDQQRLI